MSPAIITGAFPAAERGRALGANAVVVALGTSAGPTIGGVLTEHFTWRWIFYVNVPLGVIGFLATLFLLHEKHERKRVRFDPLGGLDVRSSVFDIAWRLVVTGAGQALFQSPNNSALMGAAPRGAQGVAAGFLATGRVVGQSASVAIAGAVFAAFGGAAAGRALVQPPSHDHAGASANLAALQRTFESGYHAAFVVCAAIAALGIGAALTRGADSRES